MLSLASRSIRRSSLALLALAGCASLQTAPPPSADAPSARVARVLDSLSSADDDALAAAPRIRLVVPPAIYYATRYVDASFRVTDDAYTMVLAVDLDRRVHVVYPETPDESGFASKAGPTRLTRFFAGFGGPIAGGYSVYDARYGMSERLSRFGAGGVLIAVASDRPLQFDRLVGADGDWDEGRLEALVFEQTLPGAAQSLGRALVLTGQEFSTDYSTFGGNRTLGGFTSLAFNAYGGCGFGQAYDFGSGYAGFDSFDAGRFGFGGSVDGPRFVGFYQRDGVTFARYATGGGCSHQVYYDVPVRAPTPVVPDTMHRDSAAATQRWATAGGGSAARADVRRFTPAEGHDGARERPVNAGGLRFRSPEQASGAQLRPFDRRSMPASDLPGRRLPSGEMQLARPTIIRGRGTDAPPAQPPVRRAPTPDAVRQPTVQAAPRAAQNRTTQQ